MKLFFKTLCLLFICFYCLFGFNTSAKQNDLTFSYHELVEDDSEAGQINAIVNANVDDSQFVNTLTGNEIEEIPSSYSSVTAGKVTSVKNQGSYGTCWAFSAISAAEASLLKNTNKTFDLSELQLAYYFYNTKIDPLGNASNDTTSPLLKNALNQGGNNVFTIWALANWTSACLETTLPYNSTNLQKALNKTITDDYANNYNVAHLKNAYIIPLSNSDISRNNIKKAIMEYGQVCVAFYSSNTYLNSTYYTYYCPNSTINHAVSIVGWNDSIPAEYFGTSSHPSGDGGWLIKNSWGNYGTDGDADVTKGNAEGYLWISYYDKSLLSTGKAFVYDFVEASEFQYNYQYDGSCGSSTYYVSNGSKCSAIYNLKGLTSQLELLKAVSIGISTQNVSGTVYIRKGVTDDNPLSGELLTSKQFSTTYGGYYTIDLDEEIVLKKDDVFSIIFEFNTAVYIFADYTYQNGDWITFNANTSNDKTYIIYSNGTPYNLANVSKTARIKAFTVDFAHEKDTENDWQEATYEWSNDNTSITAKRCCKYGIHEETETVTTNYKIITDATCISKGEGKYTSNGFKNSCFVVQTKSIELEINNNHKLTHHDGKEATCKTIGYEAYDTCDFCEYSTYKEISILAHKYNFNNVKWEWTEYSKAKYCISCSTCKDDFQFTATITDSITEDPTCCQKGVRTYVATVNFDDYTFNDTKDEDIDIDVNNHNYAFNNFIWDNYTAKAVYICSYNNQHVQNYNASINESVTTSSSCITEGVKTYTAIYESYSDTKNENLGYGNHNYGNWINEVEALCETNGTLGHYHCNVCNKNFNNDKEALSNIEISALNHDYVFTNFIWSDYTAKAVYTCTHNNQHIQNYDAKITNEITTTATCITAGIKTYTATYKNYFDKKNENIGFNPNNHNIEYYEYLDSTFTTLGNIEYWHCLDCFKYFSDNAYSIQIKQSDTIIDYKEVKLESINVKSNTFKTCYYIDEDIDLTGAILELLNNDGSQDEIVITEEMVTGFDSSEVGEKEAIITYQEKQTKINISYKLPYIIGDINNDNLITDADAIHLLMHTFFPQEYKVIQPLDFNKDSIITDADAIYLLMYTFFPQEYPIK